MTLQNRFGPNFSCLKALKSACFFLRCINVGLELIEC